MAAESDRRVFRFHAYGADHEFDPETGELRRPNSTVRLRPQAATVFAALLARPNELVTRDELKALVWPDTVVEADQGLNFCIRQIRAAFGDEGESGAFIETLPRRGYRLVAPDVSGVSATRVLAEPREPWTPRFRALMAIATLAFLTVAALAWWVRPSQAPQSMRVAILPFVVTPDSSSWMDELNHAIVDRLVTALAGIPDRWHVVGPATTQQFEGDRRPHTELGRILGVDLVLSGFARLSDSTLFVQGIRTLDGVHSFAWRERVWNRPADSVVAALVASLDSRLR